MPKRIYRRTKTVFTPEINDVLLGRGVLTAIEPLKVPFGGDEDVCIDGFYMELVGNAGHIRMTFNVMSGNVLADHKYMCGAALSLLGNARMPGVIDMCIVERSIHINFEAPPGQNKTEAAMDLYIKIFQSLGFAYPRNPITVPEPMIGRYTQISRDKRLWVNYGRSLLRERLALCNQ